VEAFLLDPPMRIPAGLSVSPLGVSTIVHGGVTHIVDWVGSQFYPNIADFAEECRRFGMSRRLPSNMDVSRLTRESRHLLIHARAIIENGAEWDIWDCPHYPQPLEEHDPVRRFMGCRVPTCAGLWWRDVRDTTDDAREGMVLRRMPSFSYTVPAPPPGIKPRYQPAFFASFPISRLVVVAGNDHEETLARLRAQANLPVEEVME
jgi:hypothetical protein